MGGRLPAEPEKGDASLLTSVGYFSYLFLNIDLREVISSVHSQDHIHCKRQERREGEREEKKYGRGIHPVSWRSLLLKDTLTLRSVHLQQPQGHERVGIRRLANWAERIN